MSLLHSCTVFYVITYYFTYGTLLFYSSNIKYNRISAFYAHKPSKRYILHFLAPIHFSYTLTTMLQTLIHSALGRVGPEVARSPADREVRGSYCLIHCPNVNFSRHKKSASEAPLYQSVNWYPERAVSVQVKYSWAPYFGCGVK